MFATVFLRLVLPISTQVAGRTNDAAGDGTTTASVLAREMIHYGLQVIPSSFLVPLLHQRACSAALRLPLAFI